MLGYFRTVSFSVNTILGFLINNFSTSANLALRNFTIAQQESPRLLRLKENLNKKSNKNLDSTTTPLSLSTPALIKNNPEEERPVPSNTFQPLDGDTHSEAALLKNDIAGNSFSEHLPLNTLNLKEKCNIEAKYSVLQKQTEKSELRGKKVGMPYGQADGTGELNSRKLIFELGLPENYKLVFLNPLLQRNEILKVLKDKSGIHC